MDPEGEATAAVLTFFDTFFSSETVTVGVGGSAIVPVASVLVTGAASFYLGTKINEFLDEKFDFNEILGNYIAEQLTRFQKSKIKGEHTKNARRSTRDDHQNANARRKREQDPKRRYIPGKRKKHNKDSRNHGIVLPFIPLTQPLTDEVK